MLGYVLILLFWNIERIFLIISTCFHKFLLRNKVMKGVTATLTGFGPSSTVCLPGCGLFSVCDVTVTPEGPSLTWWMLGNTPPPSLWSHLQPSTELTKVKTYNRLQTWRDHVTNLGKNNYLVIQETVFCFVLLFISWIHCIFTVLWKLPL